MKKSILNLKGVQELTKTEQKNVFGKGAGDAFNDDVLDHWHSFLPKPCPTGYCYGSGPGDGCVVLCKETPKPKN